MTVSLATLLDGLAEAGMAPPTYAGCTPQTTVEDVVADSREARPGVAFLALRGETHDGHEFLAGAVDRGAAVLLVEGDRTVPRDAPHVRLASTSAAHPVIAANLHGLPARQLRLAGVTGTNGKTTTAHLAAAALAAGGRRHARLGTTGNWLVDREEAAPFTTPFPLALQRLLATVVARGGTDVVMEVSSHALAQGRVKPLKFRAVGLTSFSQDHLDFHPSMEAYLDAKCLLAREHLEADGVAVAAVDGQDGAATFLAAAAEVGATTWRASRGNDPRAEIRALEWHEGRDGLRARVVTPNGPLELVTPLIADYNLDNALVAVGLALALGVGLDAVDQALRNATAAPGRLEAVSSPGGRGPLVYVDYAHTPDAVARTLAAIRPICDGRVVVLLGCGGDRDAGKRPQMGEVAADGADVFFATSDNPRTEDPEQIVDQMVAGVPAGRRDRVVREIDRARAIARAIAEADEDDLVLIAGKGHEDYQVLGDETIHFDDREHAAAALRAREST